MRRATVFPGSVLRCVCVGCILASAGASGKAASVDSTNSASVARRSLTLADARQLAFQRNWDLLAAKSDLDIAVAQRIVAREFPNPAASFTVETISADRHASGSASGNGFWARNYDTIAAVDQLIEIGGKRRARKDSAAAGLKGAEARLADARRLLDQGVTEAYVGVLLAESNRGVLADSAAALRQEARIAEVRQRAGEISRADQNQIEIAAERLELDAAGAEAEARKARVALEVLLGEQEPRGEIDLADGLDSLGTVSAEATNAPPATFSRPDLVAAEAAPVKAQADLRAQKAARIPDPTLLAQYEHEPPDQPNTVGFGVSFPLPLWNRNGGNIAAAEVGRPTFFSMLIIIVAHIPIFTLQRHEGRIFAPMAYTVVSALIGSLLFSLTLVPLLCYAFMRRGLPEKENLLVRTLKRLYRPSLTWALQR